MKIERLKKCHKILSFYAFNFDYREPYQILIDATFCQAALQNKVNIDDQLRKYIQTEPKFLTTQCSILEAEGLGSKLFGATQIVKKYHIHKCGHEGNPVSASKCFFSMVKKSKYIIATQDRDLQQKLRKMPGQALIYLHRATPVLEQPSNASKKAVERKKNRSLFSRETEQKIECIKKNEGIPLDKAKENFKINNRKRKAKNPNPLSCKKKKKLTNSTKVNK